jgi:hypothetical protein
MFPRLLAEVSQVSCCSSWDVESLETSVERDLDCVRNDRMEVGTRTAGCPGQLCCQYMKTPMSSHELTELIQKTFLPYSSFNTTLSIPLSIPCMIGYGHQPVGSQ